MITVSYQHGADSFVSVWYNHGTESGNFGENFLMIREQQ
jgi:hypothetical protein